jgi:hypothetical protein
MRANRRRATTCRSRLAGVHDPDVVAFNIVRPWPQRARLPGPRNGQRWAVRLHHDHHAGCVEDGCTKRQPFPWWRPRSYGRFWTLAGRDFYWPAMVTIWHREPGGHDALTVCQRRYRDRHGTWRYSKGWRFHVHHWRVQVPPAQQLRRRLLTRCAWCGGRDRAGDRVNHALSWDGPQGRWWQGEPGLYHADCQGVSSAHAQCRCGEPAPQYETWGRCGRCGRFVPHGRTGEQLERVRRLAAVPAGQRPPREGRAGGSD